MKQVKNLPISLDLS